MWEKNQYVIIVDYIFVSNNRIKNKEFRIGKILQVGKDDLVVIPHNKHGYKKNPVIIPKTACIKIDESNLDYTKLTKSPKIGDLVFCFVTKYLSDLETFVGHVYEIKVAPGHNKKYLIKSGKEEKWFSSENIMVLEDK
tara:strand:+ start:75 stop:488 length:414 start_codon:yes stop_codon:yes gene_type:complete